MGKAKKRNTLPQSPAPQSPAPAPAAAPAEDEANVEEPPARGNGGRPRPGFSNLQLGLVFGLLLMANYYGLLWVQQWYGQSDPATSSGSGSVMYQVSGDVRVRELASPSARFAEECSRAGVPVVLRNSVVEKWRARRKWSPNYIQSKMTDIAGVYQSDNRWFGPYYDTHKPLTYLSERLNNYRTDVSMSAKTFFRKLRNPSEGEFLYFTGDIDQLGQWAVDDIQPLLELLVLNPKRSSVNAWMGQPHVIAHCHYDGYHNFYTQLYGTKKFTLFQPTNWPGLYPYPFLHPSHAQAQVNLSDTRDLDSFPLAGKARALEVILQPGDLLYIPPLWFHLVESMELSISVNVWTDSEQTALMEDIHSLALPIESVEWTSRGRKAIATSVLIHTLLTKLCRERTCRRAKSDRFLDNPNIKPLEGEFYFVYQLWSTRYRTLMEKGQLPDGTHNKSEEEGILCENMSKRDSKTHVEEVTAALEESGGLHDFVWQVAARIGQLPEDTWELWTGNYVEYLAATAVEVQRVGAFMRHYGSCLYH